MLTKELAVLAAATSSLLVVFGLVSFPLYGLAIWAVLSVMLGMVAWQLIDESARGTRLQERGWSPLRATAAFSSGAFFVGVLAAETVAEFGFLNGFGIVVVLVAAGARGLRRVPAAGDGGAPPSGGHGHEDREPTLLSPAAVPGLAVEELCWTWRRTYVQLQGAPDSGARQRLALLRQACLDELERRDPAGFRRWLACGARAGSDPSRFIAVEWRGAEPGTDETG